MSKEVQAANQILPARIEAEYKDMVISQLKEEIFELRKNQVHLDKLSSMVESLETKCRGFEREKVRRIGNPGPNLRRLRRQQ
jgi:predicted house-cleaning noncanonical NTP pyrophosphatase (MazG superfamily)